ncbi:uncharacterized protein METZ01_LOCUS319911, partial [marine metagenome]
MTNAAARDGRLLEIRDTSTPWTL